MVAGSTGRDFVERALGAGVWEKQIGEFSAAPGPLPAAGLGAGAAHVGRSVTGTAACTGLLQLGALGTSATLVSASQGCRSCSSSLPMLSAEQIRGQTGIRMGMPMRKMGNALCPVSPWAPRRFASPVPRCLTGFVRHEEEEEWATVSLCKADRGRR